MKGLEELQTLLFTEREVLSLNGFSQSQDCPYAVSTHHPWVCLFTKWTPHAACTASDQLHVEALIVSFAPPLVLSKRLHAAPSACSDWFGCLIVVTPIFCHFFFFFNQTIFWSLIKFLTTGWALVGRLYEKVPTSLWAVLPLVLFCHRTPFSAFEERITCVLWSFIPIIVYWKLHLKASLMHSFLTVKLTNMV